MPLKGLFTALITPFENDQLDEKGLKLLIERQVNAGVAGIVFLGATGEASSLSGDEQKRIIEIGIREAKGKTKVVVGVGTSSTRDTIAFAKRAADLGADYVMAVSPSYVKPTQEGLFRHFEMIANHSPLPVILYNAPGRTGVNIQPSTLLKLAYHPTIIAVKDCSGDFFQLDESLANLSTQNLSFEIFSGDDALALSMIARGAKGLISVASNLFPHQMVELVDTALRGDFEKARKLQNYLSPLFKATFSETNPIPIKAALELCDLPAGLPRLPLSNIEESNKEKLAKLLKVLLLK